MLKWIAKFFIKNTKGFCGGVGCVDIVGRFSVDTGLKIFYNRPTSDMILTYTYDYQMLIEDDSKLRQIGKQKNQHADMAKHLLKVFFIPHAEEIFHHCEGFIDNNGKPLNNKTPDEQFKLLKKYHSYYLADLCSIAFELTNKCKKKD